MILIDPFAPPPAGTPGLSVEACATVHDHQVQILNPFPKPSEFYP